MFLVFFHDYYETRLLDIFRTEKLAEEYVERYCGGNDDGRFEIVEHEVRESIF